MTRLLHRAPRWVALLCLVPLSWAGPALAEDDPAGRVGRIAQVLGTGWFLDEDQSEWNPAWLNQPITRGDRVRAEPDSRLVLQVGSSTLRLDGGSEVLFSRLDDDQILVRVVRGQVALRIRQPEVVRDWALDSQDASLLPLGTGFFRLDVDGRGTRASALLGEAQLEDASRQSVTLRRGQQASLVPSGRNTWDLRWASLNDDEFDRWLRREDDAEVAWQAREGVSNEMTGVMELERHGRWDRHPEFGLVWFPAAVSVGWAPFRQGRWIWNVRWGWTWLDEAPWGFATSHYGRWTHWGGRWVWVPGAYERRPVFAPALVAWVGNTGWGVNVGIGAPPVAWVPLGPRELYRSPHHHASPDWLLRLNAPHMEPHRRHDRDFFRREPEPPRHWANSERGTTMVPGQHFEHRRAPQPVHALPQEPGRISGAEASAFWRPVAPPSSPGREVRREDRRDLRQENRQDTRQDNRQEVRQEARQEDRRDDRREGRREDRPELGRTPSREVPRAPVSQQPTPNPAPAVFAPAAPQVPEPQRPADRGPEPGRQRFGERPVERQVGRQFEQPVEQRPSDRQAERPIERQLERPVERQVQPHEQRTFGGQGMRGVEREAQPASRQFEQRPAPVAERPEPASRMQVQPGAPKFGPAPAPRERQEAPAAREPAKESRPEREPGRPRDNRSEQR